MSLGDAPVILGHPPPSLGQGFLALNLGSPQRQDPSHPQGDFVRAFS